VSNLLHTLLVKGMGQLEVESLFFSVTGEAAES
jgi:hypothetical protein